MNRFSAATNQSNKLSGKALAIRALCGTLLLTGCLGKIELLTLPPPPPASLNLKFQAEDAATAQSLGWQQGIPDVDVTLTPEDTTKAPLHLRTAGDGTLNADDIPSGRYELRAVRWLTDAERGRLARGDDAVGFLTKSTLVTGSATEPIFLTTSRRRGLVISEWMSAPLWISSVGDYFFSGYLRLYNNADTTAYLDGLIIGNGLAGQFDYPNFGCNLYRPYSEDPAGIWSLRFVQLPGTGTQYPLLPGRSAVLVTDAIDHRPLFPSGLDLRAADFEYYEGGGDVDNPAVPNASEFGQPTPFGHGLFWTSLANVVFVALPLDPGALRREALPGDFLWARIPKEKVIEVMAMKTTYRAGYAECERLVHESFDREAVKLLEFGGGPADSLAYRRLAVPFTINGRAVLQHTRWSALDFKTAPRTPFAQP